MGLEVIKNSLKIEELVKAKLISAKDGKDLSELFSGLLNIDNIKALADMIES